MALIDDLFICNTGDTYYIFHGPSLQIYEIRDPEVIKLLKSAQELVNQNSEESSLLLNQLQSAIDSASPTIKLNVNNGDNLVNSFIIPISGKCNLRCPYCFARQNGKFEFSDYSEDDIKRVIDFLNNNSRSIKNTQISFFGGEPLLNYDIVKFAVNYSHKTYPNWNVSFSITTNGTIYSEEISTFLEKNNIALLISIDGPKSTTNLRNYANGKSSVDRVIKNIAKYSRKHINIQLRATLTNHTPDIISVYDFFEKIGLPFSVVFAYKSANKDHDCSDYDDASISSIKDQLDQLVNYYINRIKSNEQIRCMSILDRLQQFEDRVIKPINCSGGHNMFSITSDGDIFSCEHLIHDKQYVIGNIESGIDSAKCLKLQSIPLAKIPACQDCIVKHLCNGGCFSEKILCNLKINDRLLESDCKLIIAQWEFIIKLFGAIKHVKPEMLKPTNYEKK